MSTMCENREARDAKRVAAAPSSDTANLPGGSARKRSQKPVKKAEVNNRHAQRRIKGNFQRGLATTFVNGVKDGWLAECNFQLGDLRFRLVARSEREHAQTPARQHPRTTTGPARTPHGTQRPTRGDPHQESDLLQRVARTPQKSLRRMQANTAAPYCPPKPDVAQPSQREATPSQHLDEDAVRTLSDVACVSTPIARTALQDAEGDVGVAADGLMRQQQEEFDLRSAHEIQERIVREDAPVTETTLTADQHTCVMHTDIPGEVPMATGASSSSAAGRSEKDDKSAAGSKHPDLPQRAPRKQPMSRIGQTGDEQLKGREQNRGRGRDGRGGGGRGSNDNRGGGDHRGGKSKSIHDNGPATRGGDG